jgi:hypothetical protein
MEEGGGKTLRTLHQLLDLDTFVQMVRIEKYHSVSDRKREPYRHTTTT